LNGISGDDVERIIYEKPGAYLKAFSGTFKIRKCIFQLTVNPGSERWFFDPSGSHTKLIGTAHGIG
jgi:hypothetical protein